MIFGGEGGVVLGFCLGKGGEAGAFGSGLGSGGGDSGWLTWLTAFVNGCLRCAGAGAGAGWAP